MPPGILKRLTANAREILTQERGTVKVILSAQFFKQTGV
jgi:hypothetical protein